VKPERSKEIEVGIRTRPTAGSHLAVTLFHMALSDLIVEGQLVGGRSGTFVNAGRARHRGVEVESDWTHGPIRLGISYTWLQDARFLSDMDETNGGVRGNRIPYSPEHMVDARIGWQAREDFGVELGLNHVSRQFANASNTKIASADGLTGLVPARTLLRLAAHYAPTGKRWRLFATAENLLDTRYISSRIDGLFAGTPLQVVAGIKTEF